MQSELKRPTAPQLVREWNAAFPAWLEVTAVQAAVEDAKLKSLGAGEREAITLALSIQAGLLLIDERKGTASRSSSETTWSTFSDSLQEILDPWL